MAKKLLSVALVALSVVVYGQAPKTITSSYSSEDAIMCKTLGSVVDSDIESWCERLVSEDFRGRRSGDVGYMRAAEWAASLFKQWGVKPLGGQGGYLSCFEQPYTEVVEHGSLEGHFIIGGDTITKEYEYLKDYFPTAMSGKGSIKGEVVYVGYGITAPGVGYDSYKNVDVKGKIVMCELGVPYTGQNSDTLKIWSEYLPTVAKVRNAVEHGAIGMIYIYSGANPSPCVEQGFVLCFASEAVKADFLAGGGKAKPSVLRKSDMASRSTGKTAEIKANTLHYPNNATANVVGVIEGSDPQLKDEYVILGAHLDHLGLMPEIYRGALDNASGSAAVLGAAKALALGGAAPKRSVIVVLFAAEELGLLGAKHFIASMGIPSSKIVSLINIDMSGKGDGFRASTSDLNLKVADHLVDPIQKWVHRPITVNVREWKYNVRPRTDGGAFSNERIPVIEYGLAGNRDDIFYHHPMDDLSQLCYSDICMLSKALAVTAITLADMN